MFPLTTHGSHSRRGDFLHAKHNRQNLSMTATHVLVIMWSLHLYKCTKDSYTTCGTIWKIMLNMLKVSVLPRAQKQQTIHGLLKKSSFQHSSFASPLGRGDP